jgi:hypothetical protein
MWVIHIPALAAAESQITEKLAGAKAQYAFIAF